MKLLYTIKIFEFTLTRNGHFGFICLRTEMVSVDYLHVYMSIFKSARRSWGRSNKYLKASYVEGKREGVDWKGGSL